jgi:hypothetical protein
MRDVAGNPTRGQPRAAASALAPLLAALLMLLLLRPQHVKAQCDTFVKHCVTCRYAFYAGTVTKVQAYASALV